MRFREFRRDETFYALFLTPRAKRRPGKTRDRSLLFTTLYSPRFLGPRFYEKSSVLIFGRVVAFSCRYDAEFSALSQLSYSESCRYSRYYLFFGVTRLVLFFSTTGHIRSRERILFGRISERGCFPRALKSTGNDFPREFPTRLLWINLFSPRDTIATNNIRRHPSPLFSLFPCISSTFLFSFFFSAQRFYRKTFSPFQSTGRDHPLSRSKIFSHSATKLFSHMAQYQYAVRLGICCNFHSNNVSVFYE